MTYQGCWSDQTPSTLAVRASSGNNNSIETCTAACSAQGYKIAGLENGADCWCGNTIGYKAFNTTDRGCTLACTGNAKQICGDANRLSLFSNGTMVQAITPSSPKTAGNFSLVGCYSDSPVNRGLSAKSTSVSSMTVENCASFCAGYKYFGVEYSQECYCANNVDCSSTVSLSGNCNMQCVANSTQFCGGNGFLNLYALPSAPSLSSTNCSATTTASGSAASSTVTASSAIISSSSLPTASATPGPLPSGVVSLGCYVDTGNPHPLPIQAYANSSNTPALCASACRAAGFQYAGTQYSTECWCGNSAPATNTSLSDCSMSCLGDASQKCGAGYRLSVTKDTVWTPSFFARHSYGTWNLAACYVDSVNGARTLPSQMSIDVASTTVSRCLDACAAGGYAVCGAEYYHECWAGNALPSSSLLAAGSDVLAAGCNYPCSGNSTEACGGSNRVLVYVNNGTAVAAASNSTKMV
ncbi:WSC domain-containing protein [Phyllosticta citriasiana]|uniref:WSC domain-containing protein n=1 Tax=Phyllosticta citriasiana TaxID=595635 RepID=UPI0030FD5BC3